MKIYPIPNKKNVYYDECGNLYKVKSISGHIDYNPDERWISIKANPNYSVSDYGRVRNNNTMRILKPGIHSNGYLLVHIPHLKTPKIHRLVAEAFLGVHPNMEVHHIDGDRTNNKLTNLCWVNHRDNIALIKNRNV